MGNSVPNWEHLPELCLLTILEKIDESISRVQFVLRSSTNLVPMLMIPSKKNITKYCGSCYGWLAIVDESFNITLSNPFENLSPLLHPNNFVVVVIYSIYMDVDEDQSLFLDILFHKGLVYAIGHYNINLVSFDVNGVEDNESSKPPKLNTLVPTILRLENHSYKVYLVKSSMGNFYSIHKHLDFEEVGERSLILDYENGKLLEKKEVESIDGDIVFVGDNRTLAVSTLDFPKGQPNCIYFTDDFIDRDTYELLGPRDIGIFHLKDRSLEKYYQFKSSHKDLSPYICISPSKEYN
ncbi:hypothetical protein ES332_A06G040200v1 [Gossypium tomentosum]|uniref:KIB1-4 beta-propeller domain-containing protein n=1 Tax=Gossypium tomentosum TaxID=34277 RepID=A0A5D2PZA4_GOSTO|nr:hypothetical protein ES332_A06G040200v1 [Gossypium tomentosum]